jgi:hypothetical protein
MKTLQTLTLVIALVTLFVSCQSLSGQNQELANKDKRNEIMQAIASDSAMSLEMIGVMMNNPNGISMMQGHQMMMGNYGSIMSELKRNPGVMQNMIAAMMETAKGDTIMMSGMINTMMGNQQMMGMMQQITDARPMNNMNGMGRKSGH